MSSLLILVQVAKRELNMDDDAYREMLFNVTGQRSAKNLSQWQLSKVIDRLKELGFKPKRKPQSAQPRALEVKKITAIWVTMHKQGFVKNGSAAAIDAYVRRMTSQMNGKGVDKAIWLNSYQASIVLESLKRWHHRLMCDAIISSGRTVPRNSAGTGKASYDKLAEYYEEMNV
ncbi:gp16 family protein [Vibrio harveyi]|uniref:gp16 family protein n=1 Tax=Vibrio harveyi TaxID=669 RepID=UPI00237FDD2A|nr:regulatory protein GemA [Vibrio harveyi]